MKVPPVDNTGPTPTGKNTPTQADKVKKAGFDMVMKEMMVKLENLENKKASSACCNKECRFRPTDGRSL